MITRGAFGAPCGRLCVLGLERATRTVCADSALALGKLSFAAGRTLGGTAEAGPAGAAVFARDFPRRVKTIRARSARGECPLVACRPTIISGIRAVTIDVRAGRNFYTGDTSTQDNRSILDRCRFFPPALAHKTRLAGFGGSVGLAVISGRNVFALAAAL